MYEIDQTYLAYELAYRAERMRGDRAPSRPAPRAGTAAASYAGAVGTGTHHRAGACRLMSVGHAMMDDVATHTSTLVGRDASSTSCWRGSAAAIRRGVTRVTGVLLSGDAGVGKTRLLTEVRDAPGRRRLARGRGPLPRPGRHRPALPPLLRDARPARHRAPRHRRRRGRTPPHPRPAAARPAHARRRGRRRPPASSGPTCSTPSAPCSRRPPRGRPAARSSSRTPTGPTAPPATCSPSSSPALHRPGRRARQLPRRRPPPPPPAPPPGRRVVTAARRTTARRSAR